MSRADSRASLARSCRLSEFGGGFDDDDALSVACTEVGRSGAYSPHSTGRSLSVPAQPRLSSSAVALGDDPADARDVKSVTHRNYLDPDLEAAINEGGRGTSSSLRRSASVMEFSRPISSCSTRSDRSRKAKKKKKASSSKRRSHSSDSSSSSASSSSSSSSGDRRKKSSKKKGKKSKKKSKKREASSESESESSSESGSGSGGSTISYRSSNSVKRRPGRRASASDGEEPEERPPSKKEEKKKKAKVDNLMMKYLPSFSRRRYGLDRSDEEEEEEETEEGGASRSSCRPRYTCRNYLSDSDSEDKPSDTTA
ncbi:hypothetical protein AAFF_G00347920 [Aldrovandia affinis]|uniref:Uncharacterized protein n=1 Tax=Aldrovandia affinis TaxID=143900 RepID=A0AAD7SJR4_9TELE|nr:hypothetical protein AAFF_G00347920 [Aldrovandia affinis]